MTISKQQIINDINNHIRKEGSGYKAWYVGISRDAKQRLFNDHNVSEGNGWWIYRTATSTTEAREIESYFVDSLRTDGGTRGGDYYSNQVYAYKKTSYTNP